MWKETYKIGVEQIDQQHRQLFLMVGDFIQAVRDDNGSQQKICKQMLDFLKTYVIVHFGSEEMLQEDINYSDKKNHKDLHRIFADALREWEFTLIRCEFSLAKISEFCAFLTRWLIHHSLREDKKMETEIMEHLRLSTASA